MMGLTLILDLFLSQTQSICLYKFHSLSPAVPIYVQTVELRRTSEEAQGDEVWQFEQITHPLKHSSHKDK